VRIHAYALAAFSTIALFAALPAKADAVAAASRSGLCLDVNTQTNAVALWPCHGGYNQTFFGGYGPQRLGNMCMDHGPLREGFPNGNGDLVMRPCNGSQAQVWILTGAKDNNPFRFRNQEGWCVNIPGGMGNARQGQQLIVYRCGNNVGNGVNDIWVSGAYGNGGQLGVAANAMGYMGQPGTIYALYTGLVSTNGGNVIAQGGGNIVSTGGGSLVASGGGNVVASGAGNLVATGGGNVIRINNGAAIIGQDGAGLVASGGGNFNFLSAAQAINQAALMNALSRGAGGPAGGTFGR
jgi:hypothetical protein